ncbi:MAG TPA: FtsX-like permease family protein [Candidatus Acidoferrales bacterium]|nr:FtsX-like permease family protein [Candidatus Acidoferrales bacterium]
MKARDLAELAGRNLREALLRNSLTTLGIGVGVASLVAMLSLGVGLQNLATERLSKTGLFNAIFVAPRQNEPRLGRAQAPGPAPEGPPKPLDDDARHNFEALPNVTEVYPEIRFPTEIHFDGNPHATVVAGVAPSGSTDGAFDGMKGAFFSSPSANEAILQIDLARELSPQTDGLIGKDVVLRYAERQALPAESSGKSATDGFSIVPREEKLRIVGIVETEPAAGFGGFGRGRLFIPLQVAETLRAAQTNDLRDLLRDGPSRKNYDSLTVRVSGASKVKDAEDAIKQMGYTAYSLLDATRSLTLVFRVFDMFLGIFGSLALVVASLGIINTLVMAILERRREIGILKALGAADRDVRSLFFVEAGAMGLLGGVSGVLIGWLIGRAINFGTNVYLARQALPAISVTAVPWWMIAFAILFSIAVSLAAGMYPASRAAKLDPVEALRYE